MSVGYLYVDMNAYFASVEQQLRPELRGRPVAVVSVLAETTCCIAASYEAKQRGIQTGTLVRAARRLCPGLAVVEARPHEYIRMHHRICQAVESCTSVQAVLSIDEMVCKLGGGERQLAAATRLAQRIKTALRGTVGPYLRCSIGLGPNRMLAKVASDMQKPDGLTAIRAADLPERLHALQLRDFPGVGPRMEQRLLNWGVTTVQQLCALPAEKLAQIWESKLLGQSWWHRLRGDDVSEPPTRRRTLGHSRVLPPDRRDDRAAGDILLRLTEKAAARLRQIGYWTGAISVWAQHLGSQAWQERRKLSPCQDTSTLLSAAGQIWKHKPAGRPLKIGLVLSDLVAGENVSGPLWETDRKLTALSHAIDRVNQQCGAHMLYFAALHNVLQEAPTRIAFTNIPDLDLEGG
ncbi:MAG: type VI secretion protein ImpB [Pirellulaceae bacterium]